jgi:D-glycero-alpha-D-manno-heptose-7-phosphate kinase
MGSSGAFTVCLLKALAQARSTSIAPGALAEAACEIEIDVLGEPVGKQDQYVAAHGGICSYTFHLDGTVDVQPLELAPDTLRRLRENMLLFFTGEARTASSVLADQVDRSNRGDTEMFDNLHATKEMGHRSEELLLSGDLDAYAELMHEHWENKRKRSPGMTSEHIDTLYTLGRRSGVIGGKLVGAGGGGFLLLYARRPSDTRQAMAAAGAQELVFDFEFGGAYASEHS